eukprot:688810-Rhodomonas_salina.2
MLWKALLKLALAAAWAAAAADAWRRPSGTLREHRDKHRPLLRHPLAGTALAYRRQARQADMAR